MTTTNRDAPIYVLVFDYRGNRQRFWSGRRPVSEYPDAMEYATFGKARAAFGKAAAYLRDQGPTLVENYGLETERVALR